MNRSNFIHAAYAVAVQVAYGIATGDWITGAVFMVGFFVGVEWMQEIYIHVRATGRHWPTKLNIYDILSGFAWVNSDRYFDVGVPALACAAVWYGMTQ